MESKEIKQRFNLVVKEEVSPTFEVHEKIESLLNITKEFCTTNFWKYYPMRDIKHHNMFILHDFKNPSMRKEFSKNVIVHRSIDLNSRTSSFEEGGTDVGSQCSNSKRSRPDTVLIDRPTD